MSKKSTALHVWVWAGLAGDAIDLIPIVTGAGETIRGLKKNRGLLSNKINSIGKKNPKYKGYLNFYNSIK